jgi:hypothetical protein
MHGQLKDYHMFVSVNASSAVQQLLLLLSAIIIVNLAAADQPCLLAAPAGDNSACQTADAVVGQLLAQSGPSRSVQLSDAIHLVWGVSGKVITFNMTAHLPANTAYLGIGLSQLGGMKGADIWLFNNSVDGSGWFLTDAYAAGFVAPVADFHDDITVLGIESSSNGSLTAAWSRFLEPCDLQDLPITTDVPLSVIWAYQEVWGYHGTTTRGTKVVNFMPVAANNNSSSDEGGGFDTSSTNAPPDEGLTTMDLAFNMTIPLKETSYTVQYFKLPSDK